MKVERYLKQKPKVEKEYITKKIYGVEWKVRKLNLTELRKIETYAYENNKFSQFRYNDALIVLATQDHFKWAEYLDEYPAANSFELPVFLFESEPETYSVLLDLCHTMNQVSVFEMEKEMVDEAKK